MSDKKRGGHISWFDVPCLDLTRAIQFYEAVLACTIAREDYENFSMGILPHEGDEIGGCLAVMQDTQPSDKGILIYLNCNDRLDEAIAAAKERGATIQQEKHQIGPHGFRSIIVDSEGNRVALHSM